MPSLVFKNVYPFLNRPTEVNKYTKSGQQLLGGSPMNLVLFLENLLFFCLFKWLTLVTYYITIILK